MSTIKDAADLINNVVCTAEMFGADNDFVERFARLTRSLGDAMVLDFQVSPKEISKMSPDTPLGHFAQKSLDDIKGWLYMKSPTNFDGYAPTG